MTVQVVTIAFCILSIAFSMAVGTLFGPLPGASAAFGCIIILFTWGLVAINRGEDSSDD